jgi:FMN phosphatase YigB (HAD superfamily)
MKTILFDLDGTLLPMSLERFTKDYCNQLGMFFADLIDGKEFIPHVFAATNAMLSNTDPRRNEEVFIEYLGQVIPGDVNTYIERFNDFYDTAFLALQEGLPPNPLIAASIKMLKEKNYKLVVATNPIFPMKANLHRISWAGLNAEDFSYISSFEKNCFCKPNPDYFREVLNTIKELPENCLMVGNDVQEDLACRKLGIKTYLIDDHLIHRGGDIITDYRGSYTDFYQFAVQLPPAPSI